MGLLDFLKTQWSGKDMTSEDRKKLFWYLKRRTSYTAWKREADAFDRFADIFEKQVIEEPTAGPKNIWCTDWEIHYPRVLKAQVDYELALRRLLQGDRTIFQYNSLGVLWDASLVAHDWYNNLVNHGYQGDHFYDGKYVPDLTDAITEFCECSRHTGYFQPRMVPTRAPHFWGEWMKDELAQVCHRPTYDDVPVPAEPVLVNSGDEIPVFGIYEPQTKDGCMNYLCVGGPAPLLWGGDGSGRQLSVSWLLIWKDERYIDGQIPAEEAEYFPIVNSTKPPAVNFISDEVISAETGAVCPKSGIWAVLVDINGRASIAEGDRMPQFNGQNVAWVWSSRL